MEEIRTVVALNYQQNNYSKILTTCASQLNISTNIQAKSPTLEDLENNAFVRRWAEFSMLIILCSIGIVGNVHTILVSLRVSDMKKRFHVRTLIIWLSTVDLTVCAVALPFEMFAFHRTFSLSSNAACKLFRYITHTTGMLSLLILTVISHERYKNICGIFVRTKSVAIVPSKLCKVTSWLKGKSTFFQHNLVSFLMLITSLVIQSPIFVFVGIRTVHFKYLSINGTQCTKQEKYRSKLTAAVYSGVVGVFGLSCFIYCSYCYGKILYLMYKQSKEEKTRVENNIQLTVAKVHKAQNSVCFRKRKTHYKVTISLIAATGFSLCGFILFSIGTAFGVSNSALRTAIITGIMKRGNFINNACNPVIYFICDNKFRHACKKLYICCVQDVSLYKL